MWTNDPFWLFMLKGLIERARPYINWIGGTVLGLYIAFSWLVGGFVFSLFSNIIDREELPKILVTWFFLPLMPIPWFCLIPYGLILLLVLTNVKFSIGWRQ